MISTQTQNTSPGNNKSRKIRYAVVGLGAFAQSDALPAFADTENSELVALVSGDASKQGELAQKYGVRHTYSYEEYDDLLKSGNIDAVYLAVPNHLHCDYTLILPMLVLSHRKRFDLLKQGILAQSIFELTKALSMRRYPLGSIAQSLRILINFLCFLSPSPLHILPLFARLP